MEFRERPAFGRGQSLRPLFRTAFVGAFLFPILLAACSYKRPILTRTDPRGPAVHREAAAETESIPDAEQHLHGWRTAEAAYEEAYGNSPDPMILHKLLTTQFLILMQEAGERIYGPLRVERLASLCTRGTTSFHEVPCRSAQEHLRQRRSVPAGQAQISGSIWDREIPVENPLLAAYLRFLLTGRNQDFQQSGKNALEALDPDRTSPLMLYLAWTKEQGELGLARSDFLKVIDGGTELCDAYYQLGVINQSRPGRDFLFNFMNNAYCRQQKLINLKEKLNGVEGMALDSARKEEVVDVLQARRHRLREETLASLFNMTKRASSIGELDATAFHQAMDEVWNQLSDPEW